MNLEQRLKDVVESVKDWKLGDFANGNRDSLPQIMLMLDGDAEFINVPDLVVRHMLNHADGDPIEALSLVLSQAPTSLEDFTKFKVILFVADGYVARRDQEYMPLTEDELEQDFRNNPESDVVEAMTVMLAEDDMVGGADIAAAEIPYVIEDGGVLQFKDARFEGVVFVEGRLPTLIREVFRAQSR